MKLAKTIPVLLAALAATASMPTDASAKSFAEGSACASQQGGRTLSGAVAVTIAVSANAPLCSQPATADVTLRLSQGNDIRTYFTTVDLGGDPCNPCAVIDALLADASLMDQIRGDFCPNSSCTIGVKELTSVGTVTTQDGDNVVYRTLADVVVTALIGNGSQK